MPRLLSGIIDRGVGLFSIEERLISFAIYIYVPILYTTVHILLQRGNGLLHNLQNAELTRTNRKLLRSARRIHQAHCEWAIGRLRAEILRQVVHLKIRQGLALIKERRRLAQPEPHSPSAGDEDDSAPDALRLGQALALLKERQQIAPPYTGPDGASPSVADEEGQASDPPETVTHWQRHYPWNFVTPMALNSRGEQIYYRVESDQDRMWAWRMDRAVDHHMAVRERDLGKLSDSHARDLRELKDGGLLRWRQRRIEALESRIVAMHKTFHNGRGLGL